MSETEPSIETTTTQMDVDEKASPNERQEPQQVIASSDDTAVGTAVGLAKEQTTTTTTTTTTDNATTGTTEETPSWDHSDRRVMLQGVFKYHDVKHCRKMVQGMIDTVNETQGKNLEIDKIKKAPKQSWVSITFMGVDMVEPFIQHVNNSEIVVKGGKRLFAKRAQSNERKRRGDDDDDGDNNKGSNHERDNRKRAKVAAAIVQSRRAVTEDEIKDKICPLWKLSDEEQRNQKLKDMIKRCTMKIIQEIKSKFRNISKEQRREVPYYDWVKAKRSIVVENVVPVPSPIRNKVEFTFGYRYLFDETTTGDQSSDVEPPKVPAVGFMILGWAGGVSKPHGCPNIGPEFCAVSDLVDTFLKDSPLPPYDSIAHTGFWRFLAIRASRRTRECMVIFTHSPSSGGQGETAEWSAHIETEKTRLIELLKSVQLPVPGQDPIQVTSIFFQEYGGLSAPSPDDPADLAYGKPTLEERLGKCTFHISPGAFFQVNTPGAEILYGLVVNKVKEVSTDPQNTLLFDVCCGTGTIGLTCMKEGVVGKVVGVDISEPAIEDAKKNAEANGYKNEGGDDKEGTVVTRFVASRAEHVMSKEIEKAKRAPGVKFVAVVDPAREGLHADMIRALRSNEKIRRIVYVSCNPTGSLIKDAGLLCQPPTKKYSGTAFQIVSATPVDMFPMTSHCEMVMTFDRLEEKKSTSESSTTEKDGKESGAASEPNDVSDIMTGDSKEKKAEVASVVEKSDPEP